MVMILFVFVVLYVCFFGESIVDYSEQNISVSITFYAKYVVKFAKQLLVILKPYRMHASRLRACTIFSDVIDHEAFGWIEPEPLSHQLKDGDAGFGHTLFSAQDHLIK